MTVNERKLHLYLTLLWLALIPPAILWWSESVPFLVMCSVYANLAGHWAAFQAAKAEENNASD